MSFCSLEFGIFVLVCFVLYYAVPLRNRTYQNIILATGSLSFVFLYDKRMIVVFAVTVVLAYTGALLIERAHSDKKKKVLLALLIILIIGILLALKYSSFFIKIPGLSALAGTFEHLKERFGLFLPIGISFYSLALVGYLADVYREQITAEKNPLDFILFASFFPHILQGPIARYSGFKKEISAARRFSYDGMIGAFQLMLWGYFKKLVVADRAALFVAGVYVQDFTGCGSHIFIASILYTFQIYADFSGCVDIARGVSKLFGIELIENFDMPYLATSIQNFWRRWHISLSSWLRDYIYKPLGGSRKGSARRMINVLVVFLVSGFWHGVGLNFIVWGLMHGLFQIIGGYWKPLEDKIRCPEKVKKVFDVVITFLLVDFAWIFFRSESTQAALSRVFRIITDQRIASFTDGSMFKYGLSAKAFAALFIFIAVMIIVDILNARGVIMRERIAKMVLPARWIIWAAAILIVLIFGIYGAGYNAADFIYMQF